MPSEKNRLLLEIDKTLGELNREIINPVLPEIGLEEVVPVMRMVARARAAYLKELFVMAAAVGDRLPSTEQIKNLRYLRVTYDELVNAAKALETAIQRGYLDV